MALNCFVGFEFAVLEYISGTFGVKLLELLFLVWEDSVGFERWIATMSRFILHKTCLGKM